MDKALWLLILAIVLALCAIVIVCCYYIRVLRLFHKLEHMLDSAISGEFEETVYDESRMSALEVRLKQYLRKQSEYEKQMEKEQSDIHALISDISHQTKTPIANLVLYTQLLREQDLPQEALPLVEQLSTQSEKLQFLITSLLKTSRLEHGIISLSPETNLIQDLLSQVIIEAEQKAFQQDIKITWKIQHELDSAFFDKKWTAEAVYNILDNAIKYTHRDDTILVEGRDYELFYRIDITDHGIGIPEEEYPKIFQRFYRAKEVQEEEGVGLGLYLTREIICAQGGYLKVSSGQGTVFSIFLPKTQSFKTVRFQKESGKNHLL